MTDAEILYAELLNNQTPLHCTRKELCDAVDRASVALQEEAKREKGCEFCKNEEHRNDSERIFYKEFPHDLNLSTSLSDAHLQIAFDNKSGWVLHFENEYDRMFDDKITHCPMCGRKLV